MIRGPKPKPVEMQVLEGNPGHKPKDQLEAVIRLPEPESLEPPEDLSPTAQEFWRRAVPVLNDVGLLSSVDTAALEMLCESYARAKQAARVLAVEGHLIMNSNGQPIPHPALAIERHAQNQFVRLAEQYALTPVARTRLGLAELQRRSLQEEMDSMGVGTDEPIELTPVD